MSASERLTKLKTIAEHIGRLWPAFLHRQVYFHKLSMDPELQKAMSNTYAAHVHNTILDTFVIDQVREIGALVLDPNPNSASVAAAIKMLEDEDVLEELRNDYRKTLPEKFMGGAALDEVTRKQLEGDFKRQQIQDNLADFERLRGEITEKRAPVLDAGIAALLKKARNKSVAHYDVVHEGNDWRMWQIEGITYGDLDAYVDACIALVERLMGFVMRTNYDFGETRTVARDYVNEYANALTIGLNMKKTDDAKRLARLAK